MQFIHTSSRHQESDFFGRLKHWLENHLRDQALGAHAVGPDQLRGIAVSGHGCSEGPRALGGEHVQQALWQQGAQVAGPRQLPPREGSFRCGRLLLLMGRLCPDTLVSQVYSALDLDVVAWSFER